MCSKASALSKSELIKEHGKSEHTTQNQMKTTKQHQEEFI